MCFAGNDRAHAAPRVGDVAASARYQVNMAVMNRLTGYGAHVDADIESFDRAIGFDNVVAKLPQKFIDSHHLRKV
jgi:hypothetical protein